MSKIKILIIAAVAAVVGYYGTTYFMGKHQIEIHPYEGIEESIKIFVNKN